MLSVEEYAEMLTGAKAEFYAQVVKDKKRADAYLPVLEGILGPLTVASIEDDAFKATDVRMVSCPRIEIPWRNQFSIKAFNRPWDFTLRYERDTGTVVEYAKVCAGYGHVYAYTHAFEGGFRLWTVLDLAVFRRCQCEAMGRIIDCHDGTFMIAFDMRHFPSALIIMQGRQ